MSNAKRRHRRRYRRAHDRMFAIWMAEMKRRGLWEIKNEYFDGGRLHVMRGGFVCFDYRQVRPVRRGARL